MKSSLHVRFLASLFLLLFPLWAMAQATLSGRVMDEEKKPLSMASVKLLNSQGEMVYGTATDNNGYFSLKNVKNNQYSLSISYVGLTEYTQVVRVGNADQKLKTITLKEGMGKLLNNVTVTAKAAEVVINNDTLEYNAGSYNLQTGAALEELIKKLPGAEVDADGNIIVNGKAVKRIMVDGKDFFTSDPKVASKNLPADMVQRVQVVDRQSDMARMSGFDDGEEETVINLKIKPDKKKGLFGSVFAGAGSEKRWETNGIVNRFSGDSQWTVVAGGNNTNNMGFSDIGVDLSQAGLPRSARRSSNEGVTTSYILGTNAAHIFSPRYEMGGNANYGYADKSLISNVEQQNLLESGSTTSKQNSANNSKTQAADVRMRMEWKPNDKTEIIIEPSFNLNKGVVDNTENFETRNDADGSMVNRGNSVQHADTKGLNANLNVEASRKLNDDGRTLSLSLRGGYEDSRIEGLYQSKLTGGTGVVLQDVDQFLNSNNKAYRFRMRLSWVEPLGKNYFLQGIYQIRSSERKSEREAFRPDADGNYVLPQTEYSRNFTNSLLTHTFGLNIKKTGALYDLTAGINFDPNTTKSHSEAGGVEIEPVKISRLNISPSLRFNYKPSKSTNLQLVYRGNTNQPSVQQMMPVPDITNPLVEYIGNPSLRPSYRNDLRMHFRTFSTQTKTSLAMFVGGSFTLDDIVSSSMYDVKTGKRTIEYKNVNGNWRMMVGGFWTMPLFNSGFSLRLGTFNMFNRNIGFINGARNSSLATMLNEDLALVYRNEWLDTGLRGTLRYQNVKNSIEVQNQMKNSFDYTIGNETTIRLPFNFDLEYDITYRTNRGYSAAYAADEWILNGALSYSFLPGRSATIRVKGYDILNQRSNISRTSTALAIRNESTNTLGRYLMVHFIYRFNIFSSGSGKNDMRSPAFEREFRGRGPH